MDQINVDERERSADNVPMTRLVPTSEAARRLGVEPATLYAYVSRGLLSRQRAIDGRTSLFAVDELDTLAQRGRRRPAAPPASVDVQITTGVTEIDEGDVHYRGWSVPHLATTASFEQVAELLWTAALPPGPVVWPAPASALVAAARASRAALGPAADGATRLTAMVATFASHDPLRGDRAPEAVAALGRRLVMGVARAGHPPNRRVGRTVAEHLAAGWVREPDPNLVLATDRALVLLADHELASSTFAVRVAASTWADPYAAIITGLGVMSGPLHGAAGTHVLDMFHRCAAQGVTAVLGDHLRRGVHVPGFGHKIYRSDDPRVGPLLEAVRRLGHGSNRLAIVEEFLSLTSARLPKRPNIDLVLGAMAFVAAVPIDVGELFAVARMAGWLAHAIEEYGEAPLRFRASGRYVGRTVDDGVARPVASAVAASAS